MAETMFKFDFQEFLALTSSRASWKLIYIDGNSRKPCKSEIRSNEIFCLK